MRSNRLVGFLLTLIAVLVAACGGNTSVPPASVTPEVLEIVPSPIDPLNPFPTDTPVITLQPEERQATAQAFGILQTATSEPVIADPIRATFEAEATLPPLGEMSFDNNSNVTENGGSLFIDWITLSWNDTNTNQRQSIEIYREGRLLTNGQEYTTPGTVFNDINALVFEMRFWDINGVFTTISRPSYAPSYEIVVARDGDPGTSLFVDAHLAPDIIGELITLMIQTAGTAQANGG